MILGEHMNNIWLYIIACLVFLGLIFLIQDVFWSFWENKVDEKMKEKEKHEDDY